MLILKQHILCWTLICFSFLDTILHYPPCAHYASPSFLILSSMCAFLIYSMRALCAVPLHYPPLSIVLDTILHVCILDTSMRAMCISIVLDIILHARTVCILDILHYPPLCAGLLGKRSVPDKALAEGARLGGGRGGSLS